MNLKKALDESLKTLLNFVLNNRKKLVNRIGNKAAISFPYDSLGAYQQKLNMHHKVVESKKSPESVSQKRSRRR